MTDSTQPRICPRCGITELTNASYCGPCANQYRRERRRAKAEANPVPCIECGKPFVKYRSRVVTCSESCRAAREVHLTGREVLKVVTCSVCGSQFMQKRSTVTECSAACHDRLRYLIARQHPAFVERKSATFRAYYAANREVRLANGAVWRETHRERHRYLSREWSRLHRYSSPRSWRRDHLNERATSQRLRYSRVRALTPFPLEHELVLQKIAYWGGKCWMCAAPYEAMDHVKPIVRGGLNIVANLRPICKSCNSRKRDRWFGPHKLSLDLRE